MKKLINKLSLYFVTAMLCCGAFAFAACNGVQDESDTNQPSENTQPINGTLYTLQQAYDENIVSYSDLLSIAYYHHSESAYPHSGTAFNAELMGESFSPVEKSPSELSSQTDISIRQNLADNVSAVTSGNIAISNFTISSYYGTYNGAAAVRVLYSAGEYFALNTVIKEDSIADITFYYTDYTLFFNLNECDFSNAVMIWKASD